MAFSGSVRLKSSSQTISQPKLKDLGNETSRLSSSRHSSGLLRFAHSDEHSCPACLRPVHPAFTIVELLVGIVVIAILAAITAVAYIGVISNARNSALISDLDQANKALNVYKESSSTETYPSTLSNTNITLDSSVNYSYNVNSDYSNYCLQGTSNGVTKSIAGNNQSVSDSTCIKATNLITNGDFSQGTSGWNDNVGTLSVTNQVGYVSNPSFIEKQSISLVSGHIYYLSSNFYLTSGAKSSTTKSTLTVRIMNGDTSKKVLEPIIVDGNGNFTIGNGDTWTRSSDIYTADGTENYFVFRFGATVFSSTIDARYDNLFICDLTTTFNSGNEPTAAQMDTMLQHFPNSWFNGTDYMQKPNSKS